MFNGELKKHLKKHQVTFQCTKCNKDFVQENESNIQKNGKICQDCDKTTTSEEKAKKQACGNLKIGSCTEDGEIWVGSLSFVELKVH